METNRNTIYLDKTLEVFRVSVFKGWKKLPTEIAESVLGDNQILHGHSTKRGALVDPT